MKLGILFICIGVGDILLALTVPSTYYGVWVGIFIRFIIDLIIIFGGITLIRKRKKQIKAD